MSEASHRANLPLLFVVQFFTWIGMFMLWVFSLPLVTVLLAVGKPPGSDMSSQAIRLVGICFATYVTLAAVINLGLPFVHDRIGKVHAHAFALLFGAAGLGTMALARSPAELVLCFAAVGIGWASISSTPYTLVTDAVRDEKYTRAMGIFNFSTVIPQVAVALCMGSLVDHVSPATAIGAGAASMALAAALMFVHSVEARKS